MPDRTEYFDRIIFITIIFEIIHYFYEDEQVI